MQSIETMAHVNQERIITIALPHDISPGKHRIVLVIDYTPSDDKSASIIDAPAINANGGTSDRI